MGYKLPNPPSPRAPVHELADFAEVQCIKSGRVSQRELLATVGRLDDNHENVGCEDDSDRAEEQFDDVMNEISARAEHCGAQYPLRLDVTGTVLDLDVNLARGPDVGKLVYIFLLLCTRLNMKSNKIQGGVDGTQLFEELSACVALNYLGSSRAEVMVVGTSAGVSFQESIDSLCLRLREGGKFRALVPGKVDAKDGGVDIVGWIPFIDGMPSKLIMFGQCKTGTTWHDELVRVQPQSFVNKWLERPLASVPVRSFFIAESADKRTWDNDAQDGGILFDRCRLVSLASKIDSALLKKIRKWTKAALKSREVLDA